MVLKPPPEENCPKVTTFRTLLKTIVSSNPKRLLNISLTAGAMALETVLK